MKSLCTAGLVLVSLGWGASAADAQSGGYQSPSLMALPPVSRASSNLMAASSNTYNSTYSTEPTPAAAAPERFNSAFTTHTRAYTDPSPEPPTPEPNAAAVPAPPTEYEQALHDSCWDNGDACGACMHCGHGSGWFGAIGGLVMGRARGPSRVLTYQDTGSGDVPVLSLQDANANWAGGAEVTLGYAFGGSNNCGPYGASGVCGGPGLAFTWWGLGEMNGSAGAQDTTGVQATALNTTFNVTGITLNGNPLSDYLQGASEQRLRRTDNVNSIELNLLSGSILNTGRLELIGLLGFRYFRFTEDLIFGSTSFGNTFVSNGGADAAYIEFDAVNNLYGAQFGAVFNYHFSPRFSVFVTPRAGIYGNQMLLHTQIYSGNGASGLDVRDVKNDVAFLGQVDAGMTYVIRSNLRLFFDYRVLGVSNIALGDNQFGAPFGDIKQSGSLILTGVNVGLAWMY